MTFEWNDLPSEVLSSIAAVKMTMTRNRDGTPYQTKENCLIALEHDPVLAGAFCHNDLTDRIDVVKDTGWHRETPALTDTDLSHIYLYLEKYYGLTNDKNIQHALDVVTAKHHYHPIRQLLESLQWDGQERVRYALHHFLGAATDDLTYECMKLFMLGAVHRVYQPGCKFETMLCLVGRQGAGKSTFFRFLALRDEWFSDDLRKVDDDNIFRKLQGHWIIELAEMVGTASAKSVEEIKSFLSRQKETYKTPYARYPKDRPRQCVFVGTSNKVGFLPLDRTGNRRFLPVRIDTEQAEVHILRDEAESRAYMEQMWAEIMVIYKSGEWSLELPEELSQQLEQLRTEHMADDTNPGLIQAWLDDCDEDYVCSRQIYAEVYKLTGNPDRRTIGEINDIMNNRITGWKQGPNHRFRDYGIQRSWQRSDRVNEPEPPLQTVMQEYPIIEDNEELPF